jgi:hypothetical protein
MIFNNWDIQMNKRIVILALTLACTALHGQQIIKRSSRFVLINTDQGIGKEGKTIPVFRTNRGETFTVGQVKILRFYRGMTAASIVEETAPYRIRINDFVNATEVKEKPKAESKNKPALVKASQFDGADKVDIAKVVVDWVLVNQDLSALGTGKELAVYRLGRQGPVEVGKVKTFKFVGGKTVLKILEHYQSVRVQEGDVVYIQKEDKNQDIDYYFFGDFAGR